MNEAEVVARLVNEYAAISVVLDRATASPRLVLRAERTGDEVSLDPVALEAIASLDREAIGRLVEVFSETERAGDAIAEPPRPGGRADG